MIDDLDSMVARLDERRRAETVKWARMMLDEPRLVQFPIATNLLLARMAGNTAHPTIVESRRIAAAWVRYQKARKSA